MKATKPITFTNSPLLHLWILVGDFGEAQNVSEIAILSAGQHSDKIDKI